MRHQRRRRALRAEPEVAAPRIHTVRERDERALRNDLEGAGRSGDLKQALHDRADVEQAYPRIRMTRPYAITKTHEQTGSAGVHERRFPQVQIDVAVGFDRLQLRAKFFAPENVVFAAVKYGDARAHGHALISLLPQTIRWKASERNCHLCRF